MGLRVGTFSFRYGFSKNGPVFKGCFLSASCWAASSAPSNYAAYKLADESLI